MLSHLTAYKFHFQLNKISAVLVRTLPLLYSAPFEK